MLGGCNFVGRLTSSRLWPCATLPAALVLLGVFLLCRMLISSIFESMDLPSSSGCSLGCLSITSWEVSVCLIALSETLSAGALAMDASVPRKDPP